MTECVASSISRWHGCKAEYYLLTCSTHSVVRWRDARRRGPGVCFSEAAIYQLLSQFKIEAKGLASWTQRASAIYKKRSLAEIRVHELRAHARTRSESISVPQDNPLDMRPQIGLANHTTLALKNQSVSK